MNSSRQLTLKRSELLPTKPRPAETMTLKEIVANFADALKQSEPIYGQPSDTNLTRIREELATLLLQIPYEKTEGTHNLIGLIRPVASYTTRYGAEFSEPACVRAYDTMINGNATAVVCARTEAAHKAKRAYRSTYKTGRRETAQFNLFVIEDT